MKTIDTHAGWETGKNLDRPDLGQILEENFQSLTREPVQLAFLNVLS